MPLPSKFLPQLLAGTFIVATCLSSAPRAEENSSPFAMGPLGLNTIPNARSDPQGTVTFGISTLDPYVHSFIGFQLADPLFISVRQTAEVSNINEDARRLYPGVDFKLRLLTENRSRPEVALGLQSAIGHKRMAGEYIAASKRYKDFDFTAGLGWGRYGTANHFSNPLKFISSSHFGGNRSTDGEMPNAPSDWFTGNAVGLFGGVEYFTPVKGLSLKLDYGADRYEAEKSAFDYDTASPWSAGLSYQPVDWASASIGIQGTDKVMGRISLRSNIDKWRNPSHDKEPRAFFRNYRTGLAIPSQMERSAQNENILLYDTTRDIYQAKSKMALQPGLSSPYQMGEAAIHMANHGGPAIEEIKITPTIMGLRGPSVKLMRHDLEQYYSRNQSSPEEIWQHAVFENDGDPFWKKSKRPEEQALDKTYYHFSLDEQISLAEEDHGLLTRTSLLTELRALRLFGLIDSGIGLRFNLHNNLDHLNEYRPQAILPVRSNVDAFADTLVGLDTLYDSISHSFTPDLHILGAAGYLEEMYAGFGGELLYRPFGSRFAIGAEAWQVFKRDPKTFMNTGLNGDHLLTGHLNAWYDIPDYDVTINASAGRYLAEDIGFTLGLGKTFDNGASLKGFLTVTDNADYDLFGGTTNAYQGIQLSLPLGGFKHMPQNSQIRTKIEPFGRDTGQRLQSPLPLYEITEPFSKPHMIRNWNEIVP